MISVRNLSFSQGPQDIFRDITFHISDNQKVGLVGPNGAGKSTLLNILTNKIIPDSGKVEVTGRIGMVPQEIKFDPDLEKATTTRDYLDPGMLHHDYELTQMLAGLEFEDLDLEGRPQLLSGGKKTKLALAKNLLAEPDILLLDEPTNFLDTAGKRWVMEFLSHYPHTLIVISHDLVLLDHAIDKVIALNPQLKTMEEYKGGYSEYLRLKEEKENLFKKQLLKETQKVKRMEEGLRKLSGRTSAKGVRQRVIMQLRVERAKDKLPEIPAEIRTMKKIVLPEPSRVGGLPLQAKNICKAYGENQILEDVSIVILRGERIALLGPNGVGKSTLIKILMGLQGADSGEVIKDPDVRIGYYSQEFETFDLSQTVIEAATQRCHLPQGEIRGVLSRFLLSGEKIFQTIQSLSGGEKTRLAIALLMVENFNLLILDEPTTYLDVFSQRVILEALKDYKGAMLVVSHTEEFINELNPAKALVLPENHFDVWSDNFLEKVSEM